MKSKIALIGGLTGGALIALSATLIAGPVTIPNSFTAGTPAKASEVNANFGAVATAVNDNDSRITELELKVTPNLVLAPSTATAGNILKGAVRFIHNFGTENTFIGGGAGNFTMTGAGNTGSGQGALTNNTTGIQNTASGFSALLNNTDGLSNTASGAFALLNNTIGNFNTAGGMNALHDNTIGSNNTAGGQGALFSNTTGSNNTASGLGALLNNISGSSNIAIGMNAGGNLTSGDNNIAIGNLGVAAEANTVRIGTGQTRAFIAGIRGVTTGVADAVNVVVDSSGQLGTVSSSRRVKDGIVEMGEASSVLMKLHPVTFHYKSDQNPQGRTLQYGLVAEDVAKVAPGLVAHSANGEIETVYYQFLSPMLLNEVQKQQRTIEAQAAELAKQTARVAGLERDRRVQAAELRKQSQDIAELRQQTARIAELERQSARMARTTRADGQWFRLHFRDAARGGPPRRRPRLTS